MVTIAESNLQQNKRRPAAKLRSRVLSLRSDFQPLVSFSENRKSNSCSSNSWKCTFLLHFIAQKLQFHDMLSATAEHNLFTLKSIGRFKLNPFVGDSTETPLVIDNQWKSQDKHKTHMEVQHMGLHIWGCNTWGCNKQQPGEGWRALRSDFQPLVSFSENRKSNSCSSNSWKCTFLLHFIAQKLQFHDMLSATAEHNLFTLKSIGRFKLNPSSYASVRVLQWKQQVHTWTSNSDCGVGHQTLFGFCTPATGRWHVGIDHLQALHPTHPPIPCTLHPVQLLVLIHHLQDTGSTKSPTRRCSAAPAGTRTWTLAPWDGPGASVSRNRTPIAYLSV